MQIRTAGFCQILFKYNLQEAFLSMETNQSGNTRYTIYYIDILYSSTIHGALAPSLIPDMGSLHVFRLYNTHSAYITTFFKYNLQTDQTLCFSGEHYYINLFPNLTACSDTQRHSCARRRSRYSSS